MTLASIVTIAFVAFVAGLAIAFVFSAFGVALREHRQLAMLEAGLRIHPEHRPSAPRCWR